MPPLVPSAAECLHPLGCHRRHRHRLQLRGMHAPERPQTARKKARHGIYSYFTPVGVSVAYLAPAATLPTLHSISHGSPGVAQASRAYIWFFAASQLILILRACVFGPALVLWLLLLAPSAGGVGYLERI